MTRTSSGSGGCVAARACRDSGRRRGGLSLRRGPPAGQRELTEAFAPFVEVYVRASVDECERRDPKGLYARARPATCRTSPASRRPTRSRSLPTSGSTREHEGAEASAGPRDRAARVTRPPEVTGQPLFVLGVRRSGTTLLRVMLDRNPAIAIPDESYFIPQLAHRHPGGTVDRRRVPRRRAAPADACASGACRRAPWPSGCGRDDAGRGDRGDLRRLRGAARQGTRWGDKTPLYMQYLPLLERTVPRRALPSHLVPGRPRRCALVPLRAPRDHDAKGGAIRRTPRGFARLVARPRSRRAARSAGASVPTGTSSSATRARARLGRRARARVRVRRARVRGRHARLRRPHRLGPQAAPAAAQPAADRRRPRLAHRAGRRPTRLRSRMLRETCSRRSATRRGAPAARSPRARLEPAPTARRPPPGAASGYVMQRSPLWRRRHPPLT